MAVAAARAKERELEEKMTVSLMICQRTCFNIASNIGRGSGWRRGGGGGRANVSYQFKCCLLVSCQLNFRPFVSCQLSGG